MKLWTKPKPRESVYPALRHFQKVRVQVFADVPLVHTEGNGSRGYDPRSENHNYIPILDRMNYE